MKFTPIQELVGGSAPVDQLSAYAHIMGMPIKPEEVIASFDWGYWGIKAFGPAAPEGKTFRTVYGTRTPEADWTGNELFAQGSVGIGLVNDTLGMEVLFGQAATNRALPSSLKLKEHGSLNDLLQFFQAALSVVAKPGESRLWVVVGLPVDHARNPAYATTVREMLTGLHTFTTIDGRKFSTLVEKIIIQSQPAGAVFDATISKQGTASSDMQTIKQYPICVFAIGGETAEVYVTRPVRDDEGNWVVEPDTLRSSSRFGAGVNVLHNHLHKTVWKHLTDQQRPSPADTDELITRGKWYNGATHQEVDLRPYLEQGIGQMEKAALEVLDSTIGLDNVDIRFIFAVGGAISMISQAISDTFGRERVFLPGETPGMTNGERDAVKVEHPERIIARGLYRYGLYQCHRWLSRKGLEA